MKVLFITAWYPNRYDAMAGLFVRKHAEAVGLYCDVKVLYVHPDETIKSIKILRNPTVLPSQESSYHLSEIEAYYPIRPKNIFHKIIKAINWVRAYWKGYKTLKQEGWKPDIVHANVLTRTGVIAYLYKKWKNTNYVITEHWTRYLPQHFTYTGFFRRKLTELVVKNASAVMPVSELLQREMVKNGLINARYFVIPNVVDDFFFKPVKKENRTKKRFLLVSCFLETAKNVCGILNATQALSNERCDFELIIIGDGPDFKRCMDYYQTMEFPAGTVSFLGEKTPREVAAWFQNSDVSIMFSNYETASVVVAESLASGVPVVATPTGIVPEVINDKNGFIVDFKDEKSLKEKMNIMMDNLGNYRGENIREEAHAMFCFQNVGKLMYDIYSEILNS